MISWHRQHAKLLHVKRPSKSMARDSGWPGILDRHSAFCDIEKPKGRVGFERLPNWFNAVPAGQYGLMGGGVATGAAVVAGGAGGAGGWIGADAVVAGA